MGQPRQPDEAGGLPIPGRELQRWPLLALLLPLIPLGILLGGSLEPERRLALLLQPGVPATSETFRLEPGPWGAPLLQLELNLPPNTSAAVDVDLLDGAQRPLLQLSKDAWREVSEWQEDGERGIDDEGDTQVRLDLRPQQAGPHRLRVELEELLDQTGTPRFDPLMARLQVRNHALNGRLLLFTAAVTALLVNLGLRAFSEQGRQRQTCRRGDRDLDCRMVVGGPGLVRLHVRARYEGGLNRMALRPPPELELMVHDSRGERTLHRRLPLRARHCSSDTLRWWMVTATVHLRFADAESRRLRVVLPSQLADSRARIDWGELTVLDGCQVLLPQPVLEGVDPATRPRQGPPTAVIPAS